MVRIRSFSIWGETRRSRSIVGLKLSVLSSALAVEGWGNGVGVFLVAGES